MCGDVCPLPEIEYLPGGHSMHLCSDACPSPKSEYLPNEHGIQVSLISPILAFVLEYLPGAHGMQALSVDRLY
jgi:hypothetical protein|tara:strand:- start:206 stop:424 length:219 start_codon:yes stop_codon:yes gene_type:complete